MKRVNCIIVTVLSLAALVAPGAAQSNSLLKGSTGVAAGASPPATQPATGVVILSSRPPGGGSSALIQPDELINPVLHNASPIAIALPQPSRISVHDLVTIIIREDRNAITDAKTQSDKKWDINSEFKKWFRLNPDDHLVGQEFPDPTPGIDFIYDSKYNTKGQFNRKDSLTTRITAEVIDVKPNGNLILEARKTINGVGDETQTMTLTGICRSKDVSPQNTVLSTQLADLRIDSKDSGTTNDATKRGWLKRFTDWAHPF